MSDSDDRQYFTYLAAWVTDRIVTTIQNMTPPDGEMGSYERLATYKELRKQADIIIEEFNHRTEEPQKQ